MTDERKRKLSRIKYERKNNETEKRKAQLLEISRRMHKKYPEKDKARNMVGNAIRKGLLVRGNCIECEDPKTQGHHEDYSKPLEVIWLCHKHHMIKHNRYIEL